MAPPDEKLSVGKTSPQWKKGLLAPTFPGAGKKSDFFHYEGSRHFPVGNGILTFHKKRDFGSGQKGG